ncbi:MAG: hypothetical protein DRP54_06255 [Spirochaetes bacterium]|nr:MAG: hypothetical protein DRP54_06255 [Spirochaetota bacterium]
MILRLSKNEVDVIKAWAESSIHGGHWGDSDLIVPEEGILLEKLEKAAREGKIDISMNEARILLTWSDSSYGIHTMEEESVIKKLKKLIESEEEY